MHALLLTDTVITVRKKIITKCNSCRFSCPQHIDRDYSDFKVAFRIRMALNGVAQMVPVSPSTDIVSFFPL